MIGSEDEEQVEKEEPEQEVPDSEPPPPLTVAELFAQRQYKLQQKKQRIATIAYSIIEEPEEHVSNNIDGCSADLTIDKNKKNGGSIFGHNVSWPF